MTDIKKDLTNSAVDRQNILNNPYAVQEIEKAAGVKGFTFKGKAVVLKEQVAAFFEVTPRTIDNYLEKYGEELRQNGYEVIRGKPLQELKILISENDVNETDFVDIKKAPQIGVFDFRSFLNLPRAHCSSAGDFGSARRCGVTRLCRIGREQLLPSFISVQSRQC